jgi:WD repeat-containing protein 81
MISVSHGSSSRSSSSKQYQGHLHGDQPHPGIHNPYVILESNSTFYLVFPFEQFTLWNCVLFSPTKLNDSSIKSLFVFYQILQCVHHYQRQGVSVGKIHLDDFFVDERSWVKLSHPDISKRLCSLDQTESNVPNSNSSSPSPDLTVPPDLPQLVQAWMLGQLSNYDYLMTLNRLAGRRMYDPNNHPILPWVTDFKSPNSGLRDLTKSKYRLNKGDGQLDVTYNPEDPLKDPLQVAHHIAEVLSDITYYVYKARQIPKSVLTTHVRQRWVPHEYPASMERLQQWTPDECIPEFYTDPEIFRSIHHDLRDLEIPHWAASPEDFIQKHREILESDYVSQRLHHWIDLTFGYKVRRTCNIINKLSYNKSLVLFD